MKLDSALEEYGLELRRRRGEDAQRTGLALDALRDYLLDYNGFTETEEIRPADLFHFLLEYYPSQEEPDPDVALALLEACAGFANWLAEREERHLAPVAAAEEKLRKELPRVHEVLALLAEHVRRDALVSPVAVSDEEEAEPTATMGSGLDRLVRLDRLDYSRSEEEYFTVQRVEEAGLVLRSAEREALEEGPADPVLVPEEAARRIRAGDILHAEIAPGPAGWELLEVFGIRPGGFDSGDLGSGRSGSGGTE